MKAVVFATAILLFTYTTSSVIARLTVTTEYKQVIENCKVSANRLWQTTAPSLTFCSLHCWVDRQCLSVSYEESSGVCVTHDVCPTACSVLGTETEGWSLLIPNITVCFGKCYFVHHVFQFHLNDLKESLYICLVYIMRDAFFL